MFDSRDVAAYIAQQCQAKNIEYNNTKIQKLLYCAYGCLLAWKHERICDEYPRAWQYGPVFPKVFKYIYKGNDIAEYSRAVEHSDADLVKQAIDESLRVFGRYNASTLSAWTHKPGSPWDKVVNREKAGLNSFMPDEYIEKYFKEKVLADAT